MRPKKLKKSEYLSTYNKENQSQYSTPKMAITNKKN